jgi:hypothetical protein
MKCSVQISIVLSVILLSACATKIALIDREEGSIVGVGTLSMSLSSDDLVSIRLQGKDYVGKWERSHCSTETCQRLENEDVRHNRHGLVGESVLQAVDGSTLTCGWLSHQGTLKGSCIEPSGKVFTIKRAERESD